MISPVAMLAPGRTHKRRSKPLLLLAFLVIAGVFITADWAVVYRLRNIERGTHAIVESMLASVEQVSRMGRDVARERRFIDAHILENEPARMTSIELEIVDVQADFDKTATAYQFLATLPGEKATWERLEASEKSMAIPIQELMKLSRQNEDAQARDALHLLQPRFDEITDDVDELIQINRQGAEHQVQLVTQLQRSVTRLQTLLSVAGILMTSMVGWWAVRLVGQREEQLVENSAMLEARNRDLDAFAGRVAHDLRNPLNTINLAAIKLAHQVPTGDETAAILHRGVSRMDALIQDMLTLSRAGSQGGDVCDPAKAVAGVCEDLSLRLKNDGGTMHVNVVPARVRGNEGLLRQALWNLVDNAVKYRRPDVAVQVELAGRMERHNYELRVSDNGIGMAPDESRKAFEPLYRAPGSRQVTGTGLGLSIVKRVIEASGGSVSVHSKLGQGTTFVINLPIVEDGHQQSS